MVFEKNILSCLNVLLGKHAVSDPALRVF